MIVVSDTSPITNLIECGLLDLLPSLYGEVVMPEGVRDELAELVPANPDYDVSGHAWVKVLKASADAEVEGLLAAGLDRGESEAIVLAEELSADLLLIDERHGASVAEERGLAHVGVLGILIAAKAQGLLGEVKPVLTQLRDEVGFWVTDAVIKKVLTLAGELGQPT